MLPPRCLGALTVTLLLCVLGTTTAAGQSIDALAETSHKELRAARIIGESEALRILLVVFVERDEDALRLISARRATRHERRRYEEGE